MKIEIGKYYAGKIVKSKWIFKVIGEVKGTYKVLHIYNSGSDDVNSFNKSDSFCTDTTFSTGDLREATFDEMNHLNQCIAADKFVEYKTDVIKENYLLY